MLIILNNLFLISPHVTLQWSDYKFYSIFKRFGEIKKIRSYYRSRGGTLNVVIEFTTSDAVEAALREREFEIGTTVICVEACSEKDFEDSTASQVDAQFCDECSGGPDASNDSFVHLPSNDESENILAILHDDCLREIFKKLNFRHYVRVANVCHRFNRIIVDVFRLRFRNSEFDLNVLMKNRLSPNEIDEFLRTFGKWIFKAKIASRHMNGALTLVQSISKIVLGSVTVHCPNVVRFRFIDFTVTEDLVKEFLPLFMRLEELIIILMNRPLPFDEVGFPAIKFPKLVKLTWTEGFGSRNCVRIFTPTIFRVLRKLLRHNQHLEKLYFSGRLWSPKTECRQCSRWYNRDKVKHIHFINSSV